MADDPYVVGEGDAMIYTPSSLVRLVSQSSDIQGYLFEVSLDFMLPAVQRVMDVSHILYIRDNPLLHLAGADASALCRSIEELSRSMPVSCADAPELKRSLRKSSSPRLIRCCMNFCTCISAAIR